MKFLSLLPKKTSSRKIPPEAFKDLFDESFGIAKFKGGYFIILLGITLFILYLLGSILKFPIVFLGSFVLFPFCSKVLKWKTMLRRLNEVDRLRIFLRGVIITFLIAFSSHELLVCGIHHFSKRFSIQIKDQSEVFPQEPTFLPKRPMAH